MPNERLRAALLEKGITLPNSRWRSNNAEHDIGVYLQWTVCGRGCRTHRIFRKKADAGATVRILLGDPDCEAVAQRGADAASTSPTTAAWGAGRRAA